MFSGFQFSRNMISKKLVTNKTIVNEYVIAKERFYIPGIIYLHVTNKHEFPLGRALWLKLTATLLTQFIA